MLENTNLNMDMDIPDEMFTIVGIDKDAEAPTRPPQGPGSATGEMRGEGFGRTGWRLWRSLFF